MAPGEPVTRRLGSHLLFKTDSIQHAQSQWASAAQSSKLTCLKGPFAAAVAGIELAQGAVFWTEATGRCHVRTVQPESSMSLALIVAGTVEWLGSKVGGATIGKPGTVLFTAPGIDAEYNFEELAGLTIKVGLASIDRIRTMALPYRDRARLSGALPNPDRDDMARLMLFLADEIDRLPFVEGKVPVQISILMNTLMARSSRLIRDRVGFPPEAGPSEQEAVLQCDRVISESSSTPRSVTELAQRVPWSVRQIYRAFDHVCDCTPTDYIRRIKLTQAKRQLDLRTDAGPLPLDFVKRFGYRTTHSFRRDYLQEFGESVPELPTAGRDRRPPLPHS